MFFDYRKYSFRIQKICKDSTNTLHPVSLLLTPDKVKVIYWDPRNRGHLSFYITNLNPSQLALTEKTCPGNLAFADQNPPAQL